MGRKARKAERERGWTRISLDRMDKALWNYKSDDPEIQSKLDANISANGQLENIVVREVGDGRYEVINGNHRIGGFGKAGIAEPMCFNVGRVSKARAMRLSIELNETRFPLDEIELSRSLAEIVAGTNVDDLLTTLPMDRRELDDRLSMLDFDWDALDEVGGSGDHESPGEFPVLNDDIATDHQCPKCGYEWSGKSK